MAKDRRETVKLPGKYEEEFLDIIEYKGGYCEAVIGNNMNDEVYMRPATEKEIHRYRNPLPNRIPITELNKIFGI